MFHVSFGEVFSLNGFLLILFGFTLLLIATVDQKYKIIPDELNLVLFLLALPHLFFCSELPFLAHFLGAFAVSVPLFLLALFFGGFGGGDIKLTAATGLFLGWQGILQSSVLAFLVSGIYSAALLLLKKATPKTEIPFGPFLCLGVFLSLFSTV